MEVPFQKLTSMKIRRLFVTVLKFVPRHEEVWERDGLTPRSFELRTCWEW